MRIGFQVDLEAKGGWNLQELQATKAFEEGTDAVRRGFRVIREQRIDDPTAYDMVGFFGVTNSRLIRECQEKKVPFLYFDKAYNRTKGWWKMSVCAHHPTRFLNRLSCPDNRRKVQRWEYQPWRKLTPNGHILLAGSSAKYHLLYELPHPTEYWTEIVAQLKAVTDRKILYRPKKSWREATPIAGTEFSKANQIQDDLKGAHCMITHGSNACFEALIEGVPSIVLGDGITAPISSLNLSKSNVDIPYECYKTSRDMILNNLAYFQWHVAELRTGIFWDHVEKCLEIQKSL